MKIIKARRRYGLSDKKKRSNMENHEKTLNNRLKWDGSHLGSYTGIFTHEWGLEGSYYYGITLPNGWSQEHPGGIIYCTATCTKNIFPCIVEDIKTVFGINRRGVHRINIDNKEYLIYYVPITIKGEVVWETPLNRLDPKHSLRQDPEFRKEIQKIIAFCDILSLCSTSEHSIRLRPGVNEGFFPISINESTTSIKKGDGYDYSIVPKNLFSKWFGEETSINDIVKEMVNYNVYNPKIPIIKGSELKHNDIGLISAEVRNKVDEIIKRYDINYVWYSYFIVDRMSRHLLIDS